MCQSVPLALARELLKHSVMRHNLSFALAAVALSLSLVAAVSCSEVSSSEAVSNGAACGTSGATQPLGDACNVCTCEKGRWACTDLNCVEPNCPAPSATTDGCAELTTWSRDPKTGGCCKYDISCEPPADWVSFTTVFACESKPISHCTPNARVPSGDGCNECVCSADGNGWDCSDNPCGVAPAGKACGYWQGGCDAGQYCAYNPPQHCSQTDMPSVCRLIPTACQSDDSPVCGCNGKTYGNRCLAALAGEGILDVGACPLPSPGGPRMCSGASSAACAPNEYCPFTEVSVCGENGGELECALRPSGCVNQYLPVCGCDEKTYVNACLAAMAGVGVKASGPCS
jgi:hypothetical protein